jgi:hypothetical protein
MEAFEPHDGYAVFRHPDFPGAEIWILGDPSHQDNQIEGIQIRGATQEQLPFLLQFVKEMAPGMKPEIMP